MYDWNNWVEHDRCCWHALPLTMCFLWLWTTKTHDLNFKESVCHPKVIDIYPSPGAFLDLVKEECDPQVGRGMMVEGDLAENPRRVCWASMFPLRVEGGSILEDGPSKSSLGFWMDDVSSRKNVVFLFYDHCDAMTTFLTSPNWWTTLSHSYCVMTSLKFFIFFEQGEPHVTLQFPISCSASRRLRSAYLKRWRPNRCGHPLFFCCRRTKTSAMWGGSCLWLFLLPRGVQQESGRLDMKDKNEKNADPSQCGCFQK